MARVVVWWDFMVLPDALAKWRWKKKFIKYFVSGVLNSFLLVDSFFSLCRLEFLFVLRNECNVFETRKWFWSLLFSLHPSHSSSLFVLLSWTQFGKLFAHKVVIPGKIFHFANARNICSLLRVISSAFVSLFTKLPLAHSTAANTK